VGFVATVALKGLGVELTRAVSGHIDVLKPTGGGHQIAGVGAVAIAFAAAGYILPTLLR